MIIIFFLFLYVIAAVAVIALVRRYLTTNRWVTIVLMAIALLLPTYDIIITNVLGTYYCYSEPNPKTLIKKKVEYPLSIYWEDNIYPGFNIEDRKLMVMNYLDGKHLQKMALNGDDGKIYVYEVNTSVWEPLKPLEQERGEKYFDTIKAIGDIIISQNQKIYTKATMPKMNYTVTFNEIKLNPLSRKFFYSDETRIVDNNTKETIAYNRRYMRFFYNIFPDLTQGNIYYYSEPVCGGDKFIPYWTFGYVEETTDEKIKLTANVRDTGIHKLSTHQKLYDKYIKGEK